MPDPGGPIKSETVIEQVHLAIVINPEGQWDIVKGLVLRNIPVIALCDTDVMHQMITYPVFCNNDS